MLSPTLGLIGGIVLEALLAVPTFWHYAFFVGGFVQMCVGRHKPGPRRAALLLAGVACGLALHHAAFRRAESDHVVTLTGKQPIHVRIRGVVLAPPRISKPFAAPVSWLSGQYTTRLLLDCEAVVASGRWRSLRGPLPVRISGVLTRVAPGDRVEVFGRLTPTRPPANPGQKDWQLFNRWRGIHAGLRCAHPQAVRIVAPGAEAGVIHALRSAARGLLLPDLRPLDDEESSLVESLVLGQRGRVGPSLNEVFARTGTSHYLSASGLHVGMLAGFVWFVTAMLGVSRRGRTVTIMMVVVLYALVAEPRAPILRATTLTLLFCLSVILHRAVHALNWIAVSAFVILVFRPTELFSAGFQLSFVVVLGIVYLTPHIVAQMRNLWPLHADPLDRLRVEDSPPPAWRRFARTVGAGVLWSLAVALAAWGAGLLLVAVHFQRIAPWGWLNSLLLMPLAFGVMIVGFVRVLVSLVWPLAGAWMGPGLDALSSALAESARWLASWPGASLAVRPPSLVLIVLVYASMIVLARVSRFRDSVSMGRIQVWRWNVMLLVGLTLLTLVWPMPSSPGGLEVRVLAVGHGSATVIRLPEGRTVLYDAGTLSPFDAAGSVIVPALLNEGVDRTDVVFISHLNADHYNALPAVLAEIPTDRIFLSTYAQTSDLQNTNAGRFLLSLGEAGTPIQALCAGDVVDLGNGVSCEVLWPPHVQTGPELSTNDTSLVLRLEYQGRSVLLCGDIEQRVQQVLLSHPRLASDVLVLPHHGAVVANTAEFLRAVAPSVVIRSSGYDAARTYSALPALVAGRTYFNTADHGAIRIRIADSRLVVQPSMVR